MLQMRCTMRLVLLFVFPATALMVSQPAIFTTMDITTDGFGFMLSVGDLAWVPFVYSLQARYLAFKPVELGPIWTAAIFVVNLTGYYIFRGANGEKNDFRNGRNPKSENTMSMIPFLVLILLYQTSSTLLRPKDRNCSLQDGGVVPVTPTICTCLKLSIVLSRSS